MLLRINKYRFLKVSSVVFITTSLLDRSILPSGFDYLCFFIFALISVYFFIVKEKSIICPKKYYIYISIFLSIIIINGIASPYTPPIQYFAIASIVTLLPFIYFIICYNYKLSRNEINKYILLIIKTLLIISTLTVIWAIFVQSGRNPFMIGFVASISNQGLILSISMYITTTKNKYIKLSALFIIIIIASVQLKAMLGMVIILFSWLIYENKNNKGRIALYSISLMICISMTIVFIPAISSKITRYSNLYDISNQNSGIARVALYYSSFEMAKNYFPLGTGQGTYGSIPTNIIYSDVYYDYNLSNIYGLEENAKYNYKMDTHWSSILGENGTIGIAIYILLLFYSYRQINKFKESNNKYIFLHKFILLLSPTIMCIEAITLAIPNRLAFMVIYSGLSAIILRYDIDNIVNKKQIN